MLILGGMRLVVSDVSFWYSDDVQYYGWKAVSSIDDLA